MLFPEAQHLGPPFVRAEHLRFLGKIRSGSKFRVLGKAGFRTNFKEAASWRHHVA